LTKIELLYTNLFNRVNTVVGMDQTEELLKKSSLLMRLFESMLSTAENEARQIANIMKRHGIEPNAPILEVGCGIGMIVVSLSRLGYRVVGIDIVPQFIERAKQLANEMNTDAEFVVGDARNLSKIFRKEEFNSILFYWGSVLGCFGKDEDRGILAQCRSISRTDAKLFVLRFPNKVTLTLLHGLLGYRALDHVLDLEDVVIIGRQFFDSASSWLYMTWRFFERRVEDLVYIDEFKTEMYVYSVDELAEIARDAGWELEKAYASVSHALDYSDMPIPHSLSAVFRAT